MEQGQAGVLRMHADMEVLGCLVGWGQLRQGWPQHGHQLRRERRAPDLWGEGKARGALACQSVAMIGMLRLSESLAWHGVAWVQVRAVSCAAQAVEA